MARIMKASEMPMPRKKREETPSTPRLKAVFRILDPWGGEIIAEFAYKDRGLAERTLTKLQGQGKTCYLQMCKVPM